MKNVYQEVPYQQDRMGRRELVHEKDLLLMQLALQPGQAVPAHKANSNVHLLVLQGRIEADLDGQLHRLSNGDLQPVAAGTPMQIKNDGTENAMFLVLKTPSPSEFKNRRES